MSETSLEVVKRYLNDALEAEKSLASHFRRFTSEGDYQEAVDAFREREAVALEHAQRLAARLDSLGPTPAKLSSLFHVFGRGDKTGQIDLGANEQITQKLLFAYTAAHNELAMYEVLATVAQAAGDSETESLARSLQQDEKAAAEKISGLLTPAVEREFSNLNS